MEAAVRTLILVRHAKSDWTHSDFPDYQRPLKRRGEKDAVQLAEKLRLMGFSPEYILSSSADRAFQTAAIVTDALALSREMIHREDSLYQGSAEDYLKAIASAPPDITRFMIFGHNPEISEAASQLIGEEIYMHTCTAVIFELEGAWNSLEELIQFQILNARS